MNIGRTEKVRMARNGMFRVWNVEAYERRPWDADLEPRKVVRYATLQNAKDFQERMSGKLYCSDFERREDAQAYLDEAKGETWW